MIQNDDYVNHSSSIESAKITFYNFDSNHNANKLPSTSASKSDDEVVEMIQIA